MQEGKMTEQKIDLAHLGQPAEEIEDTERRILTQLLERYANRKGKHLAIQSWMGKTLVDTGTPSPIPSFVITASLDWIGLHIKMGSEMPFMSTVLTEDGLLKIDESNAEDVKQRAPNYTRQPAIAAYLAHDRRRKFGSIVAVMSPSWLDQPEHEYWGIGDPEPRALRSAYTFDAFDGEGRIGLLSLEDMPIYALDGQHRVLGIRGIQELLDTPFLQLKKGDGSAKPNAKITREQFMEQFNLQFGQLQSMLEETMPIEIIPGILAGETRKQASQRIRSIFVTINAYAQRTGKGESALLDESNGYAIVARKAGTIHPLFRGDRINWKGSTLPQRSRWFTALDTLRKMTGHYLGSVLPEMEKQWKPTFTHQVPVRPSEEDLEIGWSHFEDFLDRVAELPIFHGLMSGDSKKQSAALDEARLFPGYDKDNPERGDGHLLTRPVGQEILAMAVGKLVAEGHDLDSIFEKLTIWDTDGGFSQHMPESLWYGVTYEFRGDKGKMNTRAGSTLSTAANILVYMLRGASQEDREDIIKFMVTQRAIDESTWRDLSGMDQPYDPEDPVANAKNILPKPIDS